MDSAILVQNIKLLCKAKGVPPTVACKEAGVGTSFITDINKGRTPSVAKVQMMSAYLGCTVSDLLGESTGKKKEPVIVTDDGQAKKLADALSKIGIDVGALTEADVARIAALAKVALDK